MIMPVSAIVFVCCLRGRFERYKKHDFHLNRFYIIAIAIYGRLQSLTQPPRRLIAPVIYYRDFIIMYI